MDCYEKLTGLGYKVLNVKLKEKNKVRYVKAVDSVGRELYVDFEEEASSFVGSGIVLEESQSLIAPNSLIRGGLSAVEPEVRGVAVECEGGVCIFSRENGFNLEEKSFTGKISLGYGNTPISCPLVKFREIISNPAQVEKCLSACSERLIKADMCQCDDMINTIPVCLREVNTKWEGLCARIVCKKKELLNSIALLEKYKKDSECKGDTCSEKYKTIIWNLRCRREKLYSFVCLCNHLSHVKDSLIGISEDLEQDCSWINKELCDLDCVIPLNKC